MTVILPQKYDLKPCKSFERKLLINIRKKTKAFHIQVKLGDFGLARNIRLYEYYKNDEGFIPIKWMSPEALMDGKYSSKSDVWAFAVLIWEIMTLGEFLIISNLPDIKFLTETFQNVYFDLHKYPEYFFMFVIVGTRFDIYEPEYHEYLCK